MWIIAAALSACFAGITAVLCKCGVKRADSDVATAIRTSAVLALAWIIVLITGAHNTIADISGVSWAFLVLSGLATGASWICYFKALSIGETSKVAAVDKSSVVLSTLFAIAIFPDERTLWWVKLVCIVAIAVGTFLMTDIKCIKRRKSPHKRCEKNCVDDLCETNTLCCGTHSPEPSTQSASLPSDGTESLPLQAGEFTTCVNGIKTDKHKTRVTWLVFALLSAIFAAATALLAKAGIKNVDSNAATAIRTIVVFMAAWAIVLCKKKRTLVKQIERRELLFLLLSGITTCASWICYYYAIQKGQVSVVAPIDKLSILVTVIFSALVLKDKPTKRALLGLSLLTAGAVCMAVFT